MLTLFLPSRICLIIRLPPFSLSSHRIVASSRYRREGVYEVFTDVQGRAFRFGEKSSLRHEVFVLKNLVRPNLYTEKPLKRNDRYDRKTHQKKCRINERQIRIRNSLPPLSNPHQNQKSSNNESDKDFQNSLTRPCSRPLCPLSVGSVLHRWSSRSPRMRCVAGDMEYHPRRILPRVYHRSFCLVINTLIT